MDNEKRADNIRKRFFFYLGFLILIILTLIMIRPFITTIIISLISVILLQPLYKFFLGLSFIRESRGAAIALTLLGALVIVVLPLYIVTSMTISQLTAATADLGSQEIEELAQPIQDLLGGDGAEGITEEDVTSIFDTIQRTIVSAGIGIAQWAAEQAKNIPVILTQLIILVAIVASLLPYYDDLIVLSQNVSPFGKELAELYNRKIVAMVNSIVVGVLLIAVIQGLAMGVFYWLADYDYVFLLIIISILLAIIPMVGISWLVIGLAIFAFIQGNTTQAIIVLVGFYGVVNWIDVILRPRFISKEAHLHTALFLLSLFAGLAWAGIMGLFYGPIIMLLLVTTVEIYIEKFAREDGEAIEFAVTSLPGRDKNSEDDGISLNDAGEAVIAEDS